MSYSISLGSSNIADVTPRISPLAVGLNATNQRPTANISNKNSSIEPSSFRSALIQSVRAEIEDGSFETQGRIEGTVEQLLDILA